MAFLIPGAGLSTVSIIYRSHPPAIGVISIFFLAVNASIQALFPAVPTIIA
jgi:hypothetical protein